MNVFTKRVVTWGIPVLALTGLIVYAFQPRPVPVDLVSPSRGYLQVTVDEEGRTEVHDVFTVAAPIGGRLLRTGLEPGDSVIEGETIVAQIEPSDPDFLDPRRQAEAEAAVQASRAAHRLAQAELQSAEADYEFSLAEAKRARELFANGTVPLRFVDEAERNYRTAEAAVRAARAAVDLKARELVATEARLITPIDSLQEVDPCACADITSPVSGRVLQVFEESETVVAAGTPLLEIGDPEDIEIVADYLSTDAVNIRPGMTAIIDGWGGTKPLAGAVKRVEPFGYTKVSALGIEEQRVNVIFVITSPKEDWRALGHGYRVNVNVVLWQSDQVDRLPLTALFRDDDGWAVFVAENGIAHKRRIEPGHRSGLQVEIVNGLDTGDLVVLHPNERIDEGARVADRGPER